MALVNAGVIQGFADGNFRPDTLITQDQFIAMAQRAFPDEQITADMINLRSGMTRAEAARVVYQAMADQGKMPPLATLIASHSQPMPIASQTTPTPSTETVTEVPVASAQPSPTQPSPVQPNSAESNPIQPETELSQAEPPETAPLEQVTPEVAQPQVANLEVMNVPPADAASSTHSTNANPTIAPPLTQSAVPPSTNQSAASIAVMGEVKKPGAYSLAETDTQSTLIELIQMAGGVTPTANIRQIQVRRGTNVLTLDLWQILQAGDLSKDVMLQAGDMVTVPRAIEIGSAVAPVATPASDRIQVSVVGEVKNPGRLELPLNTSVNQAILASGGLNSQAQTTELIRLNSNGTIVRRSVSFNLAQSTNDATNPRLQNNDVILVQRSEAATAAAGTAISSLLSLLPTGTVLR